MSYRIQTQKTGSEAWETYPTPTAHDLRLAIHLAKVVEADSSVFGRNSAAVRVLRLGRFTGSVKGVAWTSSR